MNHKVIHPHSININFTTHSNTKTTYKYIKHTIINNIRFNKLSKPDHWNHIYNILKITHKCIHKIIIDNVTYIDIICTNPICEILTMCSHLKSFSLHCYSILKISNKLINSLKYCPKLSSLDIRNIKLDNTFVHDFIPIVKNECFRSLTLLQNSLPYSFFEHLVSHMGHITYLYTSGNKIYAYQIVNIIRHCKYLNILIADPYLQQFDNINNIIHALSNNWSIIFLYLDDIYMFVNTSFDQQNEISKYLNRNKSNKIKIKSNLQQLCINHLNNDEKNLINHLNIKILDETLISMPKLYMQ